MECITNRMISYPLPLLILQWFSFLLIYIVSKFIICDNESIESLCILDTIRIIIILRGSLNYYTHICKSMQQHHIVRQLRSLCFFELECIQFLLLTYLFIVKEIIWQETDNLMTIFLKVFNHNLYSFDRKLRSFTMSHSNILCIDNNQWFFIL